MAPERSKISGFLIAIDDELAVSYAIEAATGMQTRSFTSSHSFLSQIPDTAPLGVFVDIHLGQSENGIDLIPYIQDQWPECPILVMTGHSEGTLVAQALAAGAHDFIRKPFECEEVTARLRVRTEEILGRLERDTQHYGDIVFHTNRHELVGPSGSVFLSSSDSNLFLQLVQANGMVVSREEIKRHIWGNLAVTNNALDKKMYTVRKAIRDVGSKITLTSIYKKGFHLIEPSLATSKIANV